MKRGFDGGTYMWAVVGVAWQPSGEIGWNLRSRATSNGLHLLVR